MEFIIKGGGYARSIDIDLVDEKCLNCPGLRIETVFDNYSGIFKVNKCEHVYFCREILDHRNK